jgi:hypothetical protein
MLAICTPEGGAAACESENRRALAGGGIFDVRLKRDQLSWTEEAGADTCDADAAETDGSI